MSVRTPCSTVCLQTETVAFLGRPRIGRSHKRSRSDELTLKTSDVAPIDREPSAARRSIRKCWPVIIQSCFVAALLLAVVGCGKPDPAHRPQRASEINDFAFLFANNCAGCHGDEGRFGPAPPLNDRLFLKIVSDQELHKVISNGRDGTPMPAFAVSEGAHLNEAQIDSLIKGLRTNWPTELVLPNSPPKPMVRKPPELTIQPEYPPYLAEGSLGNPANGAKAFATHCAVCHGENGMGGPMAGALNEGSFLQLISDQALRRIVITGRVDLGMPDCTKAAPPTTPSESNSSPDSQSLARIANVRELRLSDQEIKDIVALLAAWREASLEEAAPPSPSGSK